MVAEQLELDPAGLIDNGLVQPTEISGIQSGFRAKSGAAVDYLGNSFGNNDGNPKLPLYRRHPMRRRHPCGEERHDLIVDGINFAAQRC